ncbi:hypothetical protein [Piscibacillus halophilus]|uniref:hypothetical protein n=1 Tax=Piscibacillus halophilus TaxID=571933 RepID=UPI00158A26AC|nr:hypothetical protein [Piscibacillus halophilus]
MNVDKKRHLELGKIHKKGFEKIEVNPYAYFIDDTPYYFVLYKSRFIGTERGYAIISPEQHEDKNVKREVFAAHIKYAITTNNIEDGLDRTRVELTSHEKVKVHLENILSIEQLKNRDVYKRAFETLELMFTLQEEFNEQWNEAQRRIDDINKKGFFSEDDLEELMSYIPTFNLIQYKQLHKRYINREDFDFIYENRNHLKQSKSLIDIKILKSMTSPYVKQELENLLKKLTKNIVVTSFDTYDSIHQKWEDTFKRGLENRVEKEIELLRNPC